MNSMQRSHTCAQLFNHIHILQPHKELHTLIERPHSTTDIGQFYIHLRTLERFTFTYRHWTILHSPTDIGKVYIHLQTLDNFSFTKKHWTISYEIQKIQKYSNIFY
jgi:hypothetical protein